MSMKNIMYYIWEKVFNNDEDGEGAMGWMITDIVAYLDFLD